MVSAVNPSGIRDIDALLWGWRTDDVVITYSFPTSTANYDGYAEILGFEAFNLAQRAAVERALANIASFTNLIFSPVTGSAIGYLRFAEADGVNYTDDPNVAGFWGFHIINTAEANPPELGFGGFAPESAFFAQGDSWYNRTSYNDPALGSFAYAAGIMHETGHNLGLKHGHVDQFGHGILFPTLPSNHNSLEYSVMTYLQFPGDNPQFDNAAEHPTTYMQDDIAALQYLYGANYNYLSGNTTYSWSSTTGEHFINGIGQGRPISNFILMTLWDGGGNDTYDFSNYSTNLTVNLNPGEWTITAPGQLADLGNDGFGGAEYFARGNIANALLFQGNTASLIENVRGGSGNDTITLYGYNINNIVDGNGGSDTVVLPYVFGQGYTVSGDASSLAVTGLSGNDRFLDVEFFRFTNGVTRSAAQVLAASPAQDMFTAAVNETYFGMNLITPLSGELSSLGQFASVQFNYGQQIGVVDPFVFMYEALGLTLSESPDRLGLSTFSNLAGIAAIPNDTVFVTSNYAAIFGFQPGAPQIQHFLAQIDYFESLYLNSNAFGADMSRIGLLARGAVFGQMVGLEAETSHASSGTASSFDSTNIWMLSGLSSLDPAAFP